MDKQPENNQVDTVLTIQMNNKTGQMNVIGPIKNKLLAYGMLEMAKDIIKDYHASGKAENKIQIPDHVPEDLV